MGSVSSGAPGARLRCTVCFLVGDHQFAAKLTDMYRPIPKALMGQDLAWISQHDHGSQAPHNVTQIATSKGCRSTFFSEQG